MSDLGEKSSMRDEIIQQLLSQNALLLQENDRMQKEIRDLHQLSKV